MEHGSAQGPGVDTSSIEPLYDRIITVPNIISFIRLCLVPVYLILLLNGQDIPATVVFAIAAASDFVDGQVARRTHQVSRLGKLLDPAIDTILMFTGVLGVFLVGRIPLWVLVFIACREAFLLLGGAILLRRYHISIPVVYAGKFATTFLFFGFAGMLLNMPQIPGLGICDIGWLPGFNSQIVSWGIWPIYAGLVLQLGVTIYYCIQAYAKLRAALEHKDQSSDFAH